ncbi:DUF4184 family protein [Nocardioides sp. CPCC 205120]|uniref:DUF4184 family protein n=1 Tax=Nocardioides sp. CPCC 205120 TaxID=3406462 RepID=UPI003B508A63
MPITVAHPAVVLPLRLLGLPLTPLVVGATVPDLGLYVGARDVYGFAHSPLGLLTWAPVVTVVVVALWFTVVRDALVGLAPAAVRARLDPHVRLGRRGWAWVPIGGVVGAVTHVAWDSFTHPGRWGWENVAWLAEQHGPLPGGKWLQYGSGVTGMVVVAVAAVVWLARRPVRAEVPPRATRLPLLEVAVGAAALVAVGTAVRRVPEGLHAVAFDGVVAGCVALVVALLVATAGWHAARVRGVPDRR